MSLASRSQLEGRRAEAFDALAVLLMQDKSPPTVLCYHPHGVFTQGYMLNGSLRRELPLIVGLLSCESSETPARLLVPELCHPISTRAIQRPNGFIRFTRRPIGTRGVGSPHLRAPA